MSPDKCVSFHIRVPKSAFFFPHVKKRKLNHYTKRKEHLTKQKTLSMLKMDAGIKVRAFDCTRLLENVYACMCVCMCV